MRDRGKKNILGVLVDAVDYDAVVDRIIAAARERRSLAVSALAVHGVMTGVLDDAHRYRLNRFDMVVPDGQPVRWALNALHRAGLPDRVYGPNLMLRLCERASQEALPVYFYGSRPAVVERLQIKLKSNFPDLRVAGARASRFRQLTREEKQDVVEQIRGSEAAITFVGLGCPRQEVWAYEYREELAMPLIAVGAAFEYHAGTLPQAPALLQRYGLEWLFRLVQEPRRLWRRYLMLNPSYLALLALQASGIRDFDPECRIPPLQDVGYG